MFWVKSVFGRAFFALGCLGSRGSQGSESPGFGASSSFRSFPGLRTPCSANEISVQ